MLGMSYFAIIQYLTAAQQPPHLKAIFTYEAATDRYRQQFYHGGIMNMFYMQWWDHVSVFGMPRTFNECPKETRKLITELMGQEEIQTHTPL
jgi:predicted acyl esterase